MKMPLYTFVLHVASSGYGSSHWPLSDSASILISSSETVNLAFSSPASYVTVFSVSFRNFFERGQ